MVDFGLLRRDLLLAIRGKRSQNFVNRRLGFSFNQVYRWERGTTKIAWPDFVRLCDVCKIPLRQGLGTVLGYFGDVARTDLLIEWLLRPAPVEYVIGATGFSRAVIVHWRAGRATPALEDILALVHHISCAAVEFLATLVDVDALPSLSDEVTKRRLRSELLAAHPAVETVLAVLELETYAALARHDDGFIARQAGIEEEEAHLVVQALHELGAIELSRKKYVIAERWFASFDVRRNFDVIQRVKLHWLRRAAERLARATGFSDDERFSYYVFTSSAEVASAIDREYFEFLKRAIALVEAQRDQRISTSRKTTDRRRQTVRVLGLQLFAPGYPPNYEFQPERKR